MHLDAGCSALLPGTKRARPGSVWAADSRPDSSQTLPEPKRGRPAANGEAERSAEQGNHADSQWQRQHQPNALHTLVQSSRALSSCRGAHHELSGAPLACAWYRHGTTPRLSPSALGVCLRFDVSSPATEQEMSCVPLTFECGGCSCAGEYLFPDFVSPDEEAQLIHMLDHEEPAWRDSSFNGKYR